jgi:hypothetical protein
MFSENRLEMVARRIPYQDLASEVAVTEVAAIPRSFCVTQGIQSSEGEALNDH